MRYINLSVDALMISRGLGQEEAAKFLESLACIMNGEPEPKGSYLYELAVSKAKPELLEGMKRYQQHVEANPLGINGKAADTQRVVSGMSGDTQRVVDARSNTEYENTESKTVSRIVAAGGRILQEDDSFIMYEDKNGCKMTVIKPKSEKQEKPKPKEQDDVSLSFTDIDLEFPYRDSERKMVLEYCLDYHGFPKADTVMFETLEKCGLARMIYGVFMASYSPAPLKNVNAYITHVAKIASEKPGGPKVDLDRKCRWDVISYLRTF